MLPAAALVVLLDTPIEGPTPSPIASAMLKVALTHDVAGVMKFEPQVRALPSYDDSFARPTYELALYVADPKRFADRYVRAFAQNNFSANWMLANYGELGLLPTKDFAFTMIAERAKAGDEQAMLTVFSAIERPRNEFAPYLFEQAAQYIESQPALVMKALMAMSPDGRHYYVCTYGPAGYFDIYRPMLRALKPRTAQQRAMLQPLLHLDGCGRFDPNF
jgi:hypothetical protein